MYLKEARKSSIAVLNLLCCCRDVCKTSTPPPAGDRFDDDDDAGVDTSDADGVEPPALICILAYMALWRCGVMLSSLMMCESSASLFGRFAVSGVESDA